MTNVSFEEETLAPTYTRAIPKQSAGLTALLIRWGVAKDTRSANVVLIGVAVCSLVLTFFLLRTALVPENNLTPEQQRQIEWMSQGNVGPAPESFMPTTQR